MTATTKSSPRSTRQRLLAHLGEHPEGSTVSDLVAATALSRSAVSKALVAAETDGAAARDSGGHDGAHRAPDTWFLPAHADTTAAPDRDEPTEAPTAHAAAGQDRARPAAAEPGAADEQPADPAQVPDPADPVDAPVDPQPERTAPAPDPRTAHGPPEADEEPAAPAPQRINATGLVKAAPGELRAMVLTHLQAHPDAEFTGGEIAKVLTRSAGAIQNALDRLVVSRDADQTCPAPRRYRAAAQRQEPAKDHTAA